MNCAYLIQCHCAHGAHSAHGAHHVDYYKIVPFYGKLTAHDRYQLDLLVNMHLDAHVHAAQVHNDRCHMWMVQCLIGKSHVYVYHLDNFHLLTIHCVALLILDDHKRPLHWNRDHFGIVGAAAVPHALLDGNFGMHMLIDV